ncbi:hypothetical protein BC829DRAFT_422633 [Chytridium lagenaria]|nr:hypothetical protein BC829DRAFT_422633 [Chytridium lagenaria]
MVQSRVAKRPRAEQIWETMEGVIEQMGGWRVKRSQNRVNDGCKIWTILTGREMKDAGQRNGTLTTDRETIRSTSKKVTHETETFGVKMKGRHGEFAGYLLKRHIDERKKERTEEMLMLMMMWMKEWIERMEVLVMRIRPRSDLDGAAGVDGNSDDADADDGDDSGMYINKNDELR